MNNPLYYVKDNLKKAGLSWYKDLDLYPKNIKRMVKWYSEELKFVN